MNNPKSSTIPPSPEHEIATKHRQDDNKIDEENHENDVILLTSSEGETFRMPFAAARLSKVLSELKHERDDGGGDGGGTAEIVAMSAPNVSSDALRKVVDYCTHHALVESMREIPVPLRTDRLEETVQEWYRRFAEDAEWELLLRMVTAANFLDVRPMLRLCCLAVVIRIGGRTADEIRPMFGIRNPPWTDEEIEEVRVENEWSVEAKRRFEEKASLLSGATAAAGNVGVGATKERERTAVDGEVGSKTA